MVNVRFKRHGGALIIQVKGYYKVDTALLVRDLANVELDKAHAVKALLDLRGAAWLMTNTEWDVLCTQLAVSPIRAAMGVLVNEPDAASVWRSCMSMIQRGRTRVPFTSAAHAAEWLEVPLQALSPLREFQPVLAAGSPQLDASAG